MTAGRKESSLPAGMRDYAYRCDPRVCGEQVCCGHFDIAISAAEHDRILAMLPRLARFCPWLAGINATEEAIFSRTPCFLFLKKRRLDNGTPLCVFNFPANGRDATEGFFCALHALALAEGKNPYAEKPRGCALWPFLEDGGGNVRVDDETTCFRCLQRTSRQPQADPELKKLWEQIPTAEKGQ